MRMHPFNQNVAGFVVRRKDCSDPVCPHSLLIRNNFGAGDDSTDWIDTLALSDGRISSFLGFEWGASTMYHRLDPKQLEDDRRILAQVSVKAPGAPAELHASDIHLVASNDLFDNDHETLMECVSQFIVVDDDVIVAVPAACATGDSPTKGDPHVELFVSEDEGRTFNQACVPSPDLDLMYALVELGGVDYTHIGNVLVTGERNRALQRCVLDSTWPLDLHRKRT